MSKEIEASSKGTMLQQFEWLKRYRARFAEQLQGEPNEPVTDESLDNIMDAASMEHAAEYYEDDPEGAADEEMSNWAD
jgi:hypothetical protein